MHPVSLMMIDILTNDPVVVGGLCFKGEDCVLTCPKYRSLSPMSRGQSRFGISPSLPLSSHIHIFGRMLKKISSVKQHTRE